MQATRHQILKILKEKNQATIEELSEALDLTPVTVRHHLDILRGEGLIEVPVVKHRLVPGRPQYVYTLTEAANDCFPKNYDGFASLMIAEIRERFDSTELDRILRGIASRMAASAPQSAEGETFEQRLSRVVSFLDDKGYIARWEKSDDGYYLHVGNCPYRDISLDHTEVCVMDMTLISKLLDAAPERVSWMAAGEYRCSYHIPLQVIPAC